MQRRWLTNQERSRQRLECACSWYVSSATSGAVARIGSSAKHLENSALPDRLGQGAGYGGHCSGLGRKTHGPSRHPERARLEAWPRARRCTMCGTGSTGLSRVPCPDSPAPVGPWPALGLRLQAVEAAKHADLRRCWNGVPAAKPQRTLSVGLAASKRAETVRCQ